MHIIFIFYLYNQYLTRLLYQIMFFSKIHPAENGSIRAIPANLPFFLNVTSKLLQHISGLFNRKYQMSWCIEHEKYPNCLCLCTVVSVTDDLFVTVNRNTLFILVLKFNHYHPQSQYQVAANSNQENKADSEDESDSDSSVTVLPYEQWYVFIRANSEGQRDD